MTEHKHGNNFADWCDCYIDGAKEGREEKFNEGLMGIELYNRGREQGLKEGYNKRVAEDNDHTRHDGLRCDTCYEDGKKQADKKILEDYKRYQDFIRKEGIEIGKEQEREITKAIDENARHQINEAIINERNKTLEEVEKIINDGHYMQHTLIKEENYTNQENCPKYCNLCILNKQLQKLKGDKT